MSELLDINVELSCTGKCEGCEKYFECALPIKDQLLLQTRMQKARKALDRIKHKIISVGGKGGVGKTLCAANIATALAMKGRKVGVLDQVFDGPCIPRMLGVEGKGMEYTEEGLIPTEGVAGIKVASMGLILEEDEVITWFHEMKRNATEELICHVLWGDLDYLVVDVPAGTSSDTVNVIQYIPEMDGSTVVTIPSEVSQAVAYKAIVLLQKAKVPIFGVFENQAAFTCGKCGLQTDILQSGGGEIIAKKTDVPFIGSIPLDRRVAECADAGVPVVYKYPDSEAAKIFVKGADLIEERCKMA
ncbi:MAG: P-loop NTPase [Thermodesulfobacteriota bacterium]|nr:P-loop NTPase [Thermodesulfobacteriota bacterium]